MSDARERIAAVRRQQEKAEQDMLTYRQCKYTAHTRRRCALPTPQTLSLDNPRTSPHDNSLSPEAGRSVSVGEVLA